MLIFLQGRKGANGAQGAPGPRGQAGERGLQGEQGITGPTGPRVSERVLLVCVILLSPLVCRVSLANLALRDLMDHKDPQALLVRGVILVTLEMMEYL